MEEDEDRDEPGKKPQPLAAPALAGFTSIIAASPLLSTSSSDVAEREKEATERKIIRIPDDDRVIIPLHGDSDEEINPDRYTDPSLVVVQKIGEPAVESRKKKQGKKNSSKNRASESSSQEAKLVTPALAGLATVIAATPLLSEPRIVCDEVPDDESNLKSVAVQNTDTTLTEIISASASHCEEAVTEVNIPSKPTDSNEDIVTETIPNTQSKEDNADETLSARVMPDSIFIEKGKQQLPPDTQKTDQHLRDNHNTPLPSNFPQTKSKPETFSNIAKIATPALAGLTTLIAASPILAIVSDDESDELEEKTFPEVQERKFIAIPDQEGVIVPLHGDSDEELNPERYANPSLVGVQKVGEVKTKSKAKEEKDEIKSTPTKSVTPALAGLTSLLAASPLLAVTSDTSEGKIDEEGSQNSEVVGDAKATERKCIKISNNDIIVPLHGDSDEEIHPERYQDPTKITVEKMGEATSPRLDTPSPNHQVVKEKKTIFKVPGFKKSKEQVAKVATPLLAGMTTLLAASPILAVSPKQDDDDHGDKDGDSEDTTHDAKEVVAIKCIKTTDNEGVIIPLHGDSDEELHPERYEDPSMVTIQSIHEPAVGIPSSPATKTQKEKRKRLKPLNLKQVTTIAKEQAAKVVTPIISGVSQLLTSGHLTSTPSTSEGDDDHFKENDMKNLTAGTMTTDEDSGDGIRCVRLPNNEGVLVPLHGDSDEELHPERYDDPSRVFVQKIDTPKTEEQLREDGRSDVEGGSWPARQPGKFVTPILAGMTSLLAASPMLAVPPDESSTKEEKEALAKASKENSEQESSEPVETQGITDPSTVSQESGDLSTAKKPKDVSSKKSWIPPDKLDKVATPFLAGITTVLVAPPSTLAIKSPSNEGSGDKGEVVDQIKELDDKEEIEVHEELEERKFIKIVNQEAVIVPLHGDSDEELHPDRYKDSSLQGVHSIVGSIVEEGIPQQRPHRKKNKAKPSSDADSQPSISNDTHLDREHEYEPINPREPTQEASPLEQTKSVQFDLSHEEAIGIENTEVISPPEEAKQEEEPGQEISKQDQEIPRPTNLTTSSLAGLTALLAASPVLSSTASSDEVEQAIEEEKKEEIVERKFIRIPNETAVIIPLHGDSDEDIHPERYTDPSLQGVQRIEGPVVEIIKPPEPSQVFQQQTQQLPKSQHRPTPPSQPPPQPPSSQPPPQPPSSQPSAMAPPTHQPDDDSQSVYEPIERPQENVDQPTKSFQDRVKAGAGEIRDKFRHMSVPKISLPDRPHIKFPDRPQFLKETPQFLKERPQFLKEKPKFLTERPQFLKERPKFMTEKPKFMTEKPKFMTEKPKFLTEKPKFLKDRPKFHLPERPHFKMPEKLKFEKTKKADRPKTRKPNPSSLRRPLRDAVTISSQSGSSRNLFDTLKAKTYPRFLSKKRKIERERAAKLKEQTSLETESSLPSSPPDVRKTYPEKFRDIRFVDEEDPSYNGGKMEVQSDEESDRQVQLQGGFLRATPYNEGEMEERMKAKIDSSSDIIDSDKEQVSSGSSSMKRRVGVLEEIDSDEFFLRQKGLSREDVDVSRFLSKEIRDAFRTPKNTLALIGSPGQYGRDGDYDEDDLDVEYAEEERPKPPERRRSVKSNRSRDSDFDNFPTRPLRRKESGSDLGSKEIFEKVTKPPRKFPTKSDRRQLGSVRSLDRSSRKSETLEETPRPPSRRKSSRSLTRSRPESETDVHGGSVRIEEAHDKSLTPVRPLRLSQSRGASIDERTSRGADSLPQDYCEYERDEEDEGEEIDEEELQDEDEEVSRPVPREHIQIFHTVQMEPPLVPLKSSAVDDDNVPGYATVKKLKPPRPPPPPPAKSRKEQFQSQLQTIKSQGINFFQTFPRRAMKSLNKPRLPVRPLRNYSTIGPVRPPRRNRVFREPVYIDGDIQGKHDSEEGDIKVSEDVQIEHHEEHRDLQSGEILERMKGRPLPPPPRPPRKSKDDESLPSYDREVDDEVDEEVSIANSLPEATSIGEEVFVRSSMLNDLTTSEVRDYTEEFELTRLERVHPTIESSQQTSFDNADINVSVQTDVETVDDLKKPPVETSTQGSQTEVKSSTQDKTRDSDLWSDRRRLFDPRVVQESEDVEEEGTPPPLPPRKIVSPPAIEIPPVQISFPDRLHLSQLDVDKLNVNELQANTIKVSDIDGVTMQISEINSGTGNLILNNVELPGDFIRNLAAQIPIPTREEVPTLAVSPPQQPPLEPRLTRVLTPPPPIIVQHSPHESTGESPPTPPPQRSATTEHLPKPKTPRARRKSPTRIVDSSEDELASVIFVREKKERQKAEQETTATQNLTTETSDLSAPESSETSSVQLIKQLMTIWYRNVVSGATAFAGGVNSMFPQNEKRRDAQTAALLLVIIIATLIILGLGADSQVHHHHWDYLNPPR